MAVDGSGVVRRKMWLTLGVIASLGLGGLSVAQIPQGPQSFFPQKKVGAWIIFPLDNFGCAMGASFVGDVNLILNYDQGRNATVIGITDPKFRSLQENQLIDLLLAFVRPNGTPDISWGHVQALTVKSAAGIPGFKIKADGAMLKSFATNKGIAFLKGDVVVDQLSLTETAGAIAQLHECAAKAQAVHPSDPFAK